MDRCIRRGASGASARAREVSAKWLRVVRLRVLRPRDFRMARALRIWGARPPGPTSWEHVKALLELDPHWTPSRSRNRLTAPGFFLTPKTAIAHLGIWSSIAVRLQDYRGLARAWKNIPVTNGVLQPMEGRLGSKSMEASEGGSVQIEGPWRSTFWILIQRSGCNISTGWWLSPTPLKNHGVSSSVGMMTFHSQYDGKVIRQPCSSHHQPVYVFIDAIAESQWIAVPTQHRPQNSPSFWSKVLPHSSSRSLFFAMDEGWSNWSYWVAGFDSPLSRWKKPMAPMRLVILCQFFRKSFLGITVPYVIIIESSMFMIMIHFRRYIQPCLGHWDGNMLCDPCPQCVRKWSIWRVERLAPTVPSNCGTHCPRIWPKKGPKRSGCDEQFLLDFWHPPETPTRNEFLAC